jgi:formate/nitrite transporter FocA (FNT family)
MAVYMATISESQEGKILSIWWPITAFLVTGLEHSVANMFTLPACFMLLVRPGLVLCFALLFRPLSSPSFTLPCSSTHSPPSDPGQGSNTYGGRDPTELSFNYTDFRGDVYLIDMANRSLMDIRHTYTGFPNFGDFIAWNLIPVTLGNILGGALLGAALFYIFLTPMTDNPPSRDN